MKIIFLDFDGVVNSLLPYKNKLRYYYSKDNRVNNKQAIRLLNLLCKETKAKIVVSSTWRSDGLEKMREILFNSGLKAEVIGITPTLQYDPSNIRGDEIKTWIDNQDFKPEKYVILDDDMDFYEEQLGHLVKCDSAVGFTVQQYLIAKDLLSGN